jgi:hypothetical protein
MPNAKQSNRGNDKTEPVEEHGEHGAAGNDRGDKSGMLSKINMLMEENMDEMYIHCTVQSSNYSSVHRYLIEQALTLVFK